MNLVFGNLDQFWSQLLGKNDGSSVKASESMVGQKASVEHFGVGLLASSASSGPKARTNDQHTIPPEQLSSVFLNELPAEPGQILNP